MTEPERLTLRITRHLNASAERVFDAWLEPETVVKWLFKTPTGRIEHVSIDARVGGSFLITRRDSEDVEHVGRYLEIERPRRLVFTFAVPKFSTVATRVAIDIVPLASGCELTLTHEGVLPEWSERTQSGWGMLLEGLAAQLA